MAGDLTHRWQDALTGCTIEDLRFGHPRADELSEVSRLLGIEESVTTTDQRRIVAVPRTPERRLELA